MFSAKTLGNGKQHITRLLPLKLKKIFFKVTSCFTDLIIFFLIFQKSRVYRPMFAYFLPFLKVLAENIYYCR